ncbi:MAG: hypothetical protein NC097_04800 [Clostridium sp.]|nr:hypothetical protein [Prevotella sp.]MCM1429096.1 hypothetical protein [Clostridium sp.]MCM1475374.1 hypothetical protein [Muribaculaceae bacterium]
MNKTIHGGQSATVTNTAMLTGGIAPGNFLETGIDEELFRFNSDDTPLMNLMLKAKRVKVDSPEVDHYMIDEPTYQSVTTKNFTGSIQGALPVDPRDATIIRPYSTLLIKGVDGYDDDGKEKTPGRDLMLFVVSHDNLSGMPVVKAVNGRKNNPSDESGYIPEIPAGTKVIILANSLYETQKEVEPDLIVPQPTRVFLQKRGMNQVVSDYFDAQRKRIPFSKAILAEQAIANFKVRGNRTLWAGRKGCFKLPVDKMGMQTVYTTEGLRWQFKRELQHTGKWTVEQVIALAKMFFTGEDVPKSALLLAGKNMLEQIQCIDFSKHPEIQISTKTNKLGWTVTNFHTVFGDIEIKREPTLDRLGWSNSGALIGEDRLVHYVYSAEHSFSDRVEGQEATRNGILIWDALALKGSCHIWIDGENDGNCTPELSYLMWDKAEAPEPVEGGASRFYLLSDCPGISESAKAGQVWEYIKEDGTSSGTWVPQVLI